MVAQPGFQGEAVSPATLLARVAPPSKTAPKPKKGAKKKDKGGRRSAYRTLAREARGQARREAGTTEERKKQGIQVVEPRPLPSGQGAHRAFIVRDKTPSPIRLVPARKELRHPHPGSRGRAKEKNRKRRAKRSERDRSRRRAPEPRALRLRSASPLHQRFTQLYHQRPSKTKFTRTGRT